MAAVASYLMILGGFLMLPATFDDDPKLRLSKTAVGIFAGVVLAAGFGLSAFLALFVRNPLFQADSIYLPSVTSCATGLLTIFYDFLISSRYKWTTATTIAIITAGLSTVVYGALLIWTQRRINIMTRRGHSRGEIDSLRPPSFQSSTTTTRGDTWADPAYYQNYVQNMFPAAAAASNSHQGYEPVKLTEEEQQRQQMLNLLLQKPHARVSTPDLASSTYRLEWQDRDQDEPAPPPAHVFYAPGSRSGSEPSSANPSGMSELPNSQDVRSWSGVWRGPGPLPGSATGSLRVGPSELLAGRKNSREEREERRRAIERGH